MSVLAAGLPVEIPAFSLNRMCGSSQQAIHNASQAILANDDDIVIACGVENMSRVPMASDIGNFSEQLLDKHQVIPQGMSAELIAEHWQLSRQELDEFAYESHQKAIEATDKGLFSREILPFRENGQEIKTDEGIRRDTNLQKLSELTPSFNPSSGVITAGNSSQISDGAAGVLMMSSEKAKQLGLKPRAKIIARSVVGIDPVMMLTGVIPATEKVLKKAGLTLDQMDVIWMGKFDCTNAQRDLREASISCPDLKDQMPSMIRFYLENKDNDQYHIVIR